MRYTLTYKENKKGFTIKIYYIGELIYEERSHNSPFIDERKYINCKIIEAIERHQRYIKNKPGALSFPEIKSGGELSITGELK